MKIRAELFQSVTDRTTLILEVPDGATEDEIKQIIFEAILGEGRGEHELVDFGETSINWERTNDIGPL